MSEHAFELHPQLAKDTSKVYSLPLCELQLCNDSNYPWFILVPRVADIKEAFQLEWEQQQQLANESSLVGELIMQEFAGEKLNVAALGNMVPQLHIHHIVRYSHDASWPNPIWGQVPAKSYDEQAKTAIIKSLITKLDKIVQVNN